MEVEKTEMDDIFVDDVEMNERLIQVIDNIREADLAFESLNRLTDVYETMTSWKDSNPVSFEASVKPMLELVMAGTDIKVSDDVSVESAASVLKSIGEAIIALIKKIYKYVSEALVNMDMVATWLGRSVKLLERKRMTSRGKSPSVDHVELGNIHRYLRVGRIFADEPTRLLAELRRLLKMCNMVSGAYSKTLATGANAIATYAGNKKGEDLEKGLVTAVESMGLLSLARSISMTNCERDRWGRDHVLVSSPILGGKSLFFFDGNLQQDGLKGLRFYGFNFADTYRFAFPVAESRKFVTLGVSDLSDIPTVLTELVHCVSNSNTSIVNGSLRKTTAALEQYVSKRSSETDIAESDLYKLRTISNAFGAWTKNVAAPLFGNTLHVVRAVLAYAQASTKTYV